jgi:hypothetical protein
LPVRVNSIRDGGDFSLNDCRFQVSFEDFEDKRRVEEVYLEEVRTY